MCPQKATIWALRAYLADDAAVMRAFEVYLDAITDQQTPVGQPLEVSYTDLFKQVTFMVCKYVLMFGNVQA